ncbi:MAG TPA: TetR/AcrR family transcriptional regulator [Acidimicrobiales bacterium]|nr:TetR/AcrR family transcriptional regulator [Acidimicrobiales bacterium]
METRHRIMTVALELFAQRGFAAVTMEDIAEGAEVTKGAVYYWFADKDDLGRDIQDDLYRRLAAVAMDEFDPEGDVLANLGLAFDAFLRAVGTLGHARFFLRDAWTIPALDEGGRRHQADTAALVRGVLDVAVARGEIAPFDTEVLARILLGAWVEATLLVLETGRRQATVAVVEHLVESLRPGAGALVASLPGRGPSPTESGT